MAYIRTVKTASGACAVQIVHSSRKGSRDIEHIGSAPDDVELELLRTVARQRLAAGQDEFDLGLGAPPEAGARCRSPPRGWAICATPWLLPTSTSGSARPAVATKSSGSLLEETRPLHRLRLVGKMLNREAGILSALRAVPASPAGFHTEFSTN